MTATNDELLAELQAIRAELEESNRVLAGKASRRSLWAVAFSVALSFAVAVGGIAYAMDASHEACVHRNEGFDATRRIGVELSVGDAEALIAIVPNPTPEQMERIEAYRKEARSRAESVVTLLPDREC